MTSRKELQAQLDDLDDQLAGYRANFANVVKKTLDLAQTDLPDAEAKAEADYIAVEILVTQAQIYTIEAEKMLIKAQLVPFVSDDLDPIDPSSIEVPDFLPGEDL